MFLIMQWFGGIGGIGGFRRISRDYFGFGYFNYNNPPDTEKIESPCASACPSG
jgi:hypothetical protein